MAEDLRRSEFDTWRRPYVIASGLIGRFSGHWAYNKQRGPEIRACK